MLTCARCGITDDTMFEEGLAMPCHPSTRQCIAQLRVKIKEQQGILDKFPVNGDGEPVHIGDVQWLDGHDGPTEIKVTE